MSNAISLKSSLCRISQLSFVLLFILYIKVPAQTDPQAAREAAAKNPKMFLESAIKMMGWNEPAEPMKIVGNIYFVGTKGLTAWLITGSAGHILVNTAMPPSGKMIEASIRKLGFKPEDIKLILTCHAHIDHVGGHAYLQKISGAKIVLMADEKELIESGGKTDYHYAKESDFWFDPVKVDIILHDGEMVKLGDIAMTALHTPGHSMGGTTWVMNVVDGGKVYNVVFPDGSGINPGFHVTKPESYSGMGDNYRNTLHTLEMLKPDIWLPSHAASAGFAFEEKKKRVATEGVNAWVDPEGYRQFVISERQKFEEEVNLELGIPPKKSN
jgi:metallo-beta-lactamase class B